MKRSILLTIGLALVTVIGYSSDFTEVKKNIKVDIVNAVEAIRTDVATEIVAVKYAVIDEINVARLEVNATKVTHEYILDAGAQAWCYKLDDGNWRHDEQKSTGRFSGEAILAYEGELDPMRIVKEFMSSPPHKDLLLANYSKIGVGVKRVDNTNYIVVRLE